MIIQNNCKSIKYKSILKYTRLYGKLSTFIEKYDKFDPVKIDGYTSDYWKIINENEKHQLFSILMPPPNVTGNLHLGHALSFSLQDAIIRSKRMMGFKTIWSPGYDHAGIATQVQVEKLLQKAHGKSWNSNLINSSEFRDICHRWSKRRKHNISCQIKCLALNPNWELEYFTLNERHSQVVNRAFIELYKKNKIYRDSRIINWSCHLQSALSDIEIDSKKIDGETCVSVPGYKSPVKFGIIHKIAYKFVNDTDQELVVATTRPETIPADKYLAVHPQDSRFSCFIGKFVRNPITGSIMPVIGDEEVHPELGTGVMKVTPGHSLIDFKISKKHNITPLNLFDNFGCLDHVDNLNLKGVPRFIARDIIIDYLNHQNLYRGCNRNHMMTLPICSRSGDVVEYLIRPQWFFDVREASEKSLQAIKENKIRIQPNGYTGEFLQFLETKVPWCISRQLKWGHPIPAYFYENGDEIESFVGLCKEDVAMLSSRDPNKLYQDPDVLDTWFSSSLIPLSQAGWPAPLNKLFPSSVLVTGYDIIPLWVCRMLIMSFELVDRLPFHHVLLHGMICDSLGQKMSKSRGNVIDPMQLIGTHLFDRLSPSIQPEDSMETILDRPQTLSKNIVTDIGSDAVRLSLLEYSIGGQKVKFDGASSMAARKFLQKMWQTVRFVNHNWTKADISAARYAGLRPNWAQLSRQRFNEFHIMHRWLLHQLSSLVAESVQAHERLVFHPICITVREFWWNCLCSVFIEWCKIALRDTEKKLNLELVLLAMNTCIHVIHPVMPQITEVLWHSLYQEDVENKTLGNEELPSLEMVKEIKFSKEAQTVTVLLERVSEINFWTKSMKFSKTKLRNGDFAWLKMTTGHVQDESDQCHEIISRLTGVSVKTADDSHLESCFDLNIDDSMKLAINTQFCDRVALESGLLTRLKQLSLGRTEVMGRLVCTTDNEHALRAQLKAIDGSMKRYEDMISELKAIHT